MSLHTAAVVVKFFCLGGVTTVEVKCVWHNFTATATTAVCGDIKPVNPNI